MAIGPLVAGLLFFGGVLSAAIAVVAPDRLKVRSRSGLSFFEALGELLPRIKEGEEQNLRLVGMTPIVYVQQRFTGLVAGAGVGLVLGLILGSGPVSLVVLAVVFGGVGWVLPMLGVRDTAKKARAELDQVIRVWIVLVAQQVSAGMDPESAMLHAAQAGNRSAWRLLHRFLLAARQSRRPAWEGLVDLVDRYGVHSLAPVVSALGLATERGTRLSEAVLVAARTLWEENTSQEREKAGRRAQIVVVPATGVALGLAGILVYPPFTALTGGGLTPV